MTVTATEMGTRRAQPGASNRLARAAVVLGVAAFLPAGLWAMVGPRSFFEHAAEFHPYNQHFIQDIGAFQLGLGAVLLIVVLRPRIDAAAAALLGTGIGATAHAASHVLGHDLGGKPWSDIPMFTVIGVLLLGAGALRARALAR